MEVHRDLGYPVNAKVPGRDGPAKHLQEGEHEPTDAGVDVTAGTMAGRQPGQVDNGVNYPVRVGIGGRHDYTGPLVDQGTGGADIGPVVVVQRDAGVVHAEIMGRLGVRRMSGLGGEDLRVLNAPRAGALAVGEH